MKLTGDLINYEMNKAGFNIPEVFEKNREYSLGDFYIGRDGINSELYQIVANIFMKYDSWESSAYRIMIDDPTLRNLGSHLATILENPFAVLDVATGLYMTGGEIPDNTDGTIWELVLDQAYTPSRTFKYSKGERYFYEEHGKEPYFSYDPPFPGQHLIANIFLDNEVCFLLCTTDILRHIDDKEVFLFGKVREILEAGFKVWHERKVRNKQQLTSYYIESLLKGIQVDERIVNYNLRELGWCLEDNYRLYTITLSSSKQIGKESAEHYLERISLLDSDVLGFWYEDSIVLIRRQNSVKGIGEEVFHNRLKELLKHTLFVCGYSQCFYNFINLKYYYIQSKEALAEGFRENNRNNMVCFDEVFINCLKKSISQATSLKSLCHPRVLKVLEQDNAKGTDYLKTLQVYLVSGCNLAKSSKSLFLHRNTLAYHIEKIEDILGFSINNVSDQEKNQMLISAMLLR